ncbi:hypothetical protein pb186bvf_008365 [Paramecium bursaria]
MLCEQIDSIDSESVDKLIMQLQEMNGQTSQGIIEQSRFTVLNYPTALYNMSEDIREYLKVEQGISSRDFSKYIKSLQVLDQYLKEANFISTLVEKYLDSRQKDNYKDMIYKDAQNLLQLRQEKAFMIQLLILSQIHQEIESSGWECFTTFLDGLAKEIRLYASIKFVSIKTKTLDILQNCIQLLEELHDKDLKSKDASRRSIISQIRKASANEVNISKNYTNTMVWFLNELITNQLQSRDLIPNVRFIVKNYVKQYIKIKDDNKSRHSKGSALFSDFRSKMSLGSLKMRSGLVEFPNIGPMEILMGQQIFPRQNDIDEDQYRQIGFISQQIESHLNEQLFEQLTESTHEQPQIYYQTYQHEQNVPNVKFLSEK